MKPRVVLLSAFLSPFRSGAEACVEETSRRLTDRFDILIITARLRRSLPKRETLNGVPVIRVGLGFGLDKWLFPFLAPFAARKHRPDIVHAVLESYAGFAMMLCRFVVPSAQRMLTCQSTNTSLFLGAMHKSAHALTGLSQYIVERAKHFGREDMTLIPNGLVLADIDAALRRSKKVRGRILFVGRLVRVKGVDVLLQAFAKLHGPDLHLHIVGDGPERAYLEHLADECGLYEHVRFAGRLTGDALHQAYAEAEIFCGLSRAEAQGNVFIEAQAARCAVVATDTGGIPDTVHDGTTGLLVPANTADAAAAAIQKLIDDAPLLSRLAAAGRANAEMYDWGSIAPKYAAVYDALLSRTAHAAR